MLAELLLTVELMQALDVPARRALDLARRASTGETGETGLGSFARLAVDLRSIRSELELRLSTAIESVVRPRRGRPRALR